MPVFDTVSGGEAQGRHRTHPGHRLPLAGGGQRLHRRAPHRVRGDAAPTTSSSTWTSSTKGDEILARGRRRQGVPLPRDRRVNVVGPENVEVMNAQEGKSLITLQTCTLPDYEERLIVQGELVEDAGLEPPAVVLRSLDGRTVPRNTEAEQEAALRLSVLSSGSSGNATYIESEIRRPARGRRPLAPASRDAPGPHRPEPLRRARGSPDARALRPHLRRPVPGAGTAASEVFAAPGGRRERLGRR